MAMHVTVLLSELMQEVSIISSEEQEYLKANKEEFKDELTHPSMEELMCNKVDLVIHEWNRWVSGHPLDEDDFGAGSIADFYSYNAYGDDGSASTAVHGMLPAVIDRLTDFEISGRRWGEAKLCNKHVLITVE